MEAYLAAKLRLFSEVVDSDGTAVIWADDPVSSQVIDAARARGLKVMTVGEAGEALRLVSRTTALLGQTLQAEADGKAHSVNLPLIGAYKAANALVAAALGMATGGDGGTQLGQLGLAQPVGGGRGGGGRT